MLNTSLSKSGSGRVERRIRWVPPTGEWMKLNTDGVLRGNPGLAAADGVLRDGDGNWCGGFAVNISKCYVPLAELWREFIMVCILPGRGRCRM